VHFLNGMKDENYVNHYKASHHEHWVRVLKERDGPSPFLALFKSLDEQGERLREHEDELAKLKAAKFAPLFVKTRFERAGLLDVHQSVYHFESDGVHTTLQALMERHFEIVEGRLEISIYKERALKDQLSRLDSMAACLVDAMQKLHERYKSGRSKEVGELSDEFATQDPQLSLARRCNRLARAISLGGWPKPRNPCGIERR
jgi:hypothetical protein